MYQPLATSTTAEAVHTISIRNQQVRTPVQGHSATKYREHYDQCAWVQAVSVSIRQYQSIHSKIIDTYACITVVSRYHLPASRCPTLLACFFEIWWWAMMKTQQNWRTTHYIIHSSSTINREKQCKQAHSNRFYRKKVPSRLKSIIAALVSFARAHWILVPYVLIIITAVVPPYYHYRREG